MSSNKQQGETARRIMPFAENNGQQQHVQLDSCGTTRNPSKKTKRHHSTGSSIDTNTHWRQMFHDLQEERVTCVEENLQKVLQESEQREEALKNYIRHLESDLVAAKQGVEMAERNAQGMLELQQEHVELKENWEQLKREHHDLETEHKAVSQANQETNQKLTEQVQEVQQHLTLHQKLTAMTVLERTSDTVTCKVENRNMDRATTFVLRTLDDTMTRYEPIESEATHQLPTFLREAIDFETHDVPSLLQNVLKGMFPDDE